MFETSRIGRLCLVKETMGYFCNRPRLFLRHWTSPPPDASKQAEQRLSLCRPRLPVSFRHRNAHLDFPGVFVLVPQRPQVVGLIVARR